MEQQLIDGIEIMGLSIQHPSKGAKGISPCDHLMQGLLFHGKAGLAYRGRFKSFLLTFQLEQIQRTTHTTKFI